MRRKFIAFGSVWILIIGLATFLIFHIPVGAPVISQQLVKHSYGYVGPPYAGLKRYSTVVPIVSPKSTSQQNKVDITTSTKVLYPFPNCLTKVGWYYGWHGNVFEFGTDFDCNFRTALPALWGGTVEEAERTCWNVVCSSSSGGLVVIQSFVPGLGTQCWYALHLDFAFIRVGEVIPAHQIIGLTGGQTYGGHWNTSPWFTSGAHVEIGFDWPYAKYHCGSNFNPLPWIERTISIG